MALIFGDDGSESPRTHALIIGVGGYRHLQGGEQEIPQTIEHVGLLKQLTSPPRSAIAFAELLLSTSNDWQAPLGSIDLLISPAPNDPKPVPDTWQFTPALIGNIQSAYDSWKERCNRNADNVAVFYYCGHGVEKSELHLLAGDFGENPNQPWSGSFAFYGTRLAFHECQAKTQCFFIDACRRVTSGMLTKEPTKIPLDTSDYRGGECEYNLTILGSARNASALGPPKKVSYFTQALLRILKGAVASESGNGWVIETGDFVKHLINIIGKIKPNQGYKQRCSFSTSDNTMIMRVPTPKVDVIFECEPDEANNVVELSCSFADDPRIFNAQHSGAPWALQLDAGIYETNARFNGNDFINVKKYFNVSPIIKQIPKLRCVP